MPVPAGIRCPMMMFSLSPSRSSRAPRIAASVSTRVVSWNDAAEMNDCVVRLAFVIPSSKGSDVAGLPPFFTARSFTTRKVSLSTCSPSRNSVSPGSTTFTFCSIWRTITPMCLSLIFTPWSRYTSCTSFRRYSCTARGPLIRRMSCGFTGPSVRRSPARTRSPSCTRKCLPAGTSYSCASPSSGCTQISRLPRLISPNRTTPSTSEIVAGSFGRRASNSSATRGSPPVMSRVLYASRDTLASTWPAYTSWPSSTVSCAPSGMTKSRLFVALFLDDFDVRMELLLPVFDDHALAPAGDFVQLLAHRLVVHDVHEPHQPAHVRHDRVRVRIPREQHAVLGHLLVVVDHQRGAERHLEARVYRQFGRRGVAAVGRGLEDQLALVARHHPVAFRRLDVRQPVAVLDHAFDLRLPHRLLRDACRGAADVEGPQRQLRTRLADRLRGQNADRLAEVHHVHRREVAAVAHPAHAAFRLARQHGADLHRLDARTLGLPSSSSSCGSITSSSATQPTTRSRSGSMMSSPSFRADISRPRIVPQSSSVIVTSCATSTSLRVK